MSPVLPPFIIRRVAVDEAETANVMRIVAQGIDAQLRNPLSAFARTVRSINYGGCYAFEAMTHEKLARIDPAQALEYHHASFGDPSHFTVVLTGEHTRRDRQEPCCARQQPRRQSFFCDVHR